MNSSDSSNPDRLDEIIADYLAAIEQGNALSPDELIAANPEFATELLAFLKDKRQMDELAFGVANDREETPAGALTQTIPTTPKNNAQDPTANTGSSIGETIRYFGDYELLAEIARGGMGVVYKARQVSLNRIVALKMILAGTLATDLDVQRFRAEAEAAANLDHPGIVPIFEVGEHDGKQYFSMAYIDGGSLARRVSELVNDRKAAVSILLQVCRAVHFAHQRGILHRDLKPANILLDSHGMTHVTDFGLAKRVDGNSGVTLTGSVVGTPSYMAPEQARAEKLLTTAADVYAIGAVLYELLSGRPPFRGSTPVATLRQVLDEEPVRPRMLNPAIDRELETIALKCLEKDPSARYESASTLADDLERWQRGEPIHARPVMLPERVWKWIKRRPVAAALIGTATALVLIIAVGGPLVKMREDKLQEDLAARDRQAKEATKLADTAQEDRATAQTERDATALDALQINTEMNLRRARAIRLGEEQGGPSQVTKLLSETANFRQSMGDLAVISGEGAVQRNDQFWETTWRQLNEEASQWLTNSFLLFDRSMRLPSTKHTGQANINGGQKKEPEQRAVSPDGRWLARPRQLDERGFKTVLEIIAIDTGIVATSIDLKPSVTVTPAFNKDGQLLIAFRYFPRMVKVLENGRKELQDEHLLAVETRTVPSGELVNTATIDLNATFPVPPQDIGRTFPERTVASGFRNTVLFFSADRKSITIFEKCDDYSKPADHFAGRPFGVFEVGNGELVAKTISRTFRPIAAMPNGEKLIGLQLTNNEGGSRGILEMQLLDIATGEIENTHQLGLGEWPDHVDVSPDGCWLAMMQRNELMLHELNGTRSDSVHLPETQRQMRYTPSDQKAFLPLFKFSLDGQLLTVVTAREIHLLRVPDLVILRSKSHGLNNGKDASFSQAVVQPLSTAYLPDGRLAAGFSFYDRHQPPGEEIWQVWHSSAAKIQPDPMYSAVGPINSVHFLSNSQVAVVSAGYRGFEAINFSRTEKSISQGPMGPESKVRPAIWWTHEPGLGIESGFDNTGHWFVQGAGIWDVSTGRQHRSFPKIRALARSHDGRYLAMREAPPANPLEQVAILARIAMRLPFGSPDANCVRVWDLEADREQSRFDSWTINQCEFSPDSKYLIGNLENERRSRKSEFIIGRVADGATVGRGSGFYDFQNRQLDDPSGTKLIVQDERGKAHNIEIYLVEWNSSRILETFKSNEIKPAISRSGQTLAVVTFNEDYSSGKIQSNLTVWSEQGGLEQPIEVGVRPEKGTPNVLAFGADETQVIVTGKDNSGQDNTGKKVLELWDVSARKRVFTTAEVTGSLLDFHVAPGAGSLATWYSKNAWDYNVSQFELRDLKTGDVKATYPGFTVIGEADGGKLLVLEHGGYKTIKVIEAATGKIRKEWDERGGSVLLSPDGRIVCVRKTQLSLWHVAEDRSVVISTSSLAAFPSEQLWFTPDSRKLVCSDQTTGVISIWDTNEGSQVGTVDPRGVHTLPGGQVGGNHTLQISPDSKTIAATIHGQIRLFDIATGRRITAFPRTSHGANALAVSADGKWVASAGVDPSVGLWHAVNGQFAAMLDGYPGGVRAVEFTPDCKQLLTRDATGHFALWRIEPRGEDEPEVALVWQRKGPAPAAKASALAINPNGKQFAYGNVDGTVVLGRLAAGDDEQTLPDCRGAILSVAYRNDGQQLAAGGTDGMVWLWDLNTAKISSEWSVGQGEIRAVAFQPGTELLATAGTDIQLWQTAPPQLLLHVSEPENPVLDISFSSDGRYLLTGGEDKTARRIDLAGQLGALKDLGLGW